MRETYLKLRKTIAIGVITIALLTTSMSPSINLEQVFQPNGVDQIIVEIYQKPAEAAQKVNYDQVAKNYEVKVYVDSQDNQINFTNDSGRPFIALNRTFVPYRIMSEALGAKVDWTESERKVTASGNDQTVELFIGNPQYKVNGEKRQMDVEPFILTSEGRTYIPARYLTEGLNYTIDFAQDGKVMYIVSFTQGQTEAERKAVLDEIVNKGEVKPNPGVGEIKGGKLTDEQRKYVRDTFMNTYSNAEFEWRLWEENDPVHLTFVKLIKAELGQDAIVDTKLFAKMGSTNSYFVTTPKDGTVHIVRVYMNADETFSIRTSGFIKNVF